MGSGAPRSQLFVKAGARAPCLWSQRHCDIGLLRVYPVGVIDALCTIVYDDDDDDDAAYPLALERI